MTAPAVAANCNPGGVSGVGNYDFETDVNGWAVSSGAPATVAVSTEQKVTGSQSLKVSIASLAAGNDFTVGVSSPKMYCGNAVTLNLWTPAGSDALWLQAFSQLDDSQWSAGPPSVARGSWTSFSYTIPDTDPFGIQEFGVRIGLNCHRRRGGQLHGRRLPRCDHLVRLVAGSGRP